MKVHAEDGGVDRIGPRDIGVDIGETTRAKFADVVKSAKRSWPRASVSVSRPAWAGASLTRVELGLAIALLVPLEAMHAWIAYGWVGPLQPGPRLRPAGGS